MKKFKIAYIKKGITIIMLSLSLVLSATSPLAVQASSAPSSWATDEVNEAINADLVTDSVKSDYQADITREQFCEMVVRAYEKISNKTAQKGLVSFTDTSNIEILKAANLGIVTGYGNSVFGPNDLITREQIAAMLVRMIDKSVSYANINVYNDNYFKDKNSISDWAVSSVNFAYDKGIMQGVGNNCIDPQANTTCEQAILLVYRTVNKYYDEGSQLDSVYELTEEHIAQDDKTFVHYTDNMVLAFIERGLSEKEKEDIADIIGGDVVAQLAGSINLLQIEVGVSTYDELDAMAEKLMKNYKVYYASPDILIDKNMISDSTSNTSKRIYAGEDEWWFKSIEADYVWKSYADYIKVTDVGVIECGTILSNHSEYNGKISYAIAEQETFNDVLTYNLPSEAEHATAVTGIIAANRYDDYGTAGVDDNSNIIFSTIKLKNENNLMSDYEEKFSTDFLSEMYPVYLMKKQVEVGAKAINCSFGMHYVSKEEFEKNKGKEGYEFKDYESFRRYEDICANITSKFTAAGMCQLIENKNEFLVVQGAGNGEDNGGPGVDAVHSGLWAAITYDNCAEVLAEFNISHKELLDYIFIVGAVENNKNNSDYYMTTYSNYGETVSMCAPGGYHGNGYSNDDGIYVCSSENNYMCSSGTSMAAPMVTGTAAVLWGIDPTLTAAEVKNYIVNGAKCKAIGVTGEDAGREYPMLNVRGAVEELLKTKKVAITVGDKDDNSRIQDATISYGNGLNETTDIIGNCDIYLVDDNHEITISKEGYKTVTVTVEDKYIGQDGEWIDIKEILLEKEKTIDYSTYIGKWDWENSIPLLNNQENWYTYDEAWVDIKNVNGNDVTLEFYHQKGGKHLYFYDVCHGTAQGNIITAYTDARKIPGDPVMANFKITLTLYDGMIHVQSYNITEDGEAFSGDYYLEKEQHKEPFVDMYNFSELQDNSIAYDFNGDGHIDSLKTHLSVNYWAYYSLVINNQKVLFDIARHGTYAKLCVTDINTADNYLDIILFHDYKGITADIYRYDGANLLKSNEFYTVNNEYRDVSLEQYEKYIDEINIAAGDGTITFSCGNGVFSYDSLGEFQKVDLWEKEYNEAFNDYKDILSNTSFNKYTLYDINRDYMPELILSNASNVGFDTCHIYTWNDGEAKKVGEDTIHYGLYKCSWGGILFETGGTGVVSYIKKNINNNKLTEDTNIFLSACYIPGNESFSFQGKDVSEAEYLSQKPTEEDKLTFIDKNDLSYLNDYPY